VADELRTGEATFQPKFGTLCTNPVISDITRKAEWHDCGNTVLQA